MNFWANVLWVYAFWANIFWANVIWTLMYFYLSQLLSILDELSDSPWLLIDNKFSFIYILLFRLKTTQLK
jgi:hypothetical protein